MHVHRDFLQLLHHGAKLIKVAVGRVLKIDRDMDIRHAETADACRLVRQSLLVREEPEVDDVSYAERVYVRELRLGWLTGRGDPIVEPSPVIDLFRISHMMLRIASRSKLRFRQRYQSP